MNSSATDVLSQLRDLGELLRQARRHALELERAAVHLKVTPKLLASLPEQLADAAFAVQEAMGRLASHTRARALPTIQVEG